MIKKIIASKMTLTFDNKINYTKIGLSVYILTSHKRFSYATGR